MRPVSPQFRAAIRASHAAVVKVEVLQGGVPIPGVPDLTAPAGGALIGGTVTLDGRAASRGRMDLSLVDDGTRGLVPTSATSLLAPFGREVRISRGLVLPSGEIEAPAIGVFRIDSCRVEGTGSSLTVSIEGLDRSATVTDARFEAPYDVAAGSPVEDAVRAVLQAALPGVVTRFPSTTFVTPALRASEGDDPWQFARDMATACGLELYFDGDGAAVMAPRAPGDIVAILTEGEGGVLLSAAADWKRDGKPNRVIATGENVGEGVPARGVATDDDPASPTYYYGPFGKVPQFYVSQFIATDDQALAAAAGILQRTTGSPMLVEFNAFVDPSLEPDDTVRITRAAAGIDEDHVIDSLTIPLSVTQSMTGQTRAKPKPVISD